MSHSEATPDEIALRSRLGGLSKAARYDGREGTEAARRAFRERFLTEVDPENVLDPDERERRAAAARSAYFTKLALQSRIARRKARELTEIADNADRQIDAMRR